MIVSSSYSYLSDLTRRTARTYWILVRVVIPAMIVVRVATDLGLVAVFSRWLSPVMAAIGLPGQSALVWATALLTNLFAGVAVFLQIASPDLWTTAQVSVLGLMMLFAHAMPIEAAVARMTGLPLWYSCVLRIGTAIFAGYLSTVVLQGFDVLQGPADFGFSGQETAHDSSLATWALAQGKTLLFIYIIILAMTVVLDLIQATGLDRVIAKLLAPFFRLLGCRTTASDMTIVGLTLGLSYGAGMMVEEARSARVDAYDRTSVLSFLSLSHSLIEDTLVVGLMGGALSVLLGVRLLFTFAIVAILRFSRVFLWLTAMDTNSFDAKAKHDHGSSHC